MQRLNGPYAASHGCPLFLVVSAIPIANHAALISGSFWTAARYAASALSNLPCFMNASPAA